MVCPACQTDNIPGSDLCEDCGLDLAGLDVQDLGVDSADPLWQARIVPMSQPAFQSFCEPWGRATIAPIPCPTVDLRFTSDSTRKHLIA